VTPAVGFLAALFAPVAFQAPPSSAYAAIASSSSHRALMQPALALIPFASPMLLQPAVAGGGGGGADLTPHRYWKLSVTAAQSDATGVIALTEIIYAASAGGPQVAAAATITGPAAGSGSVALLIDGSRSSQYSTVAGGFPRDILIDFGATSGNWKAIHEIRLVGHVSWLPQAPKDFTLSWSDDNASFTSRIAVTGAAAFSGDKMSSVFRSATCPDTLSGFLYYRLNCSAGNQTSQFAVGEVEFRGAVGGADLSGAAGGVFYSTQSSGNEASKAFDNNNSTGYFSQSGAAYPQNLGVELEQRQTVVEASIIPYSGFPTYAPKDFTIEGSNDRSSWTAVITGSSQTGWAANPTARTFT
jgi:hypothetical protein